MLFLSCSRDRTIRLPLEQDQLVVYCTFNPDSTWKLWLSSTVSIGGYSQQFPAVNNAEVVIYENGAAFDTLINSADGIYISLKKPTLGNNYSFMAKATGFETVSGKDSIPLEAGSIIQQLLLPTIVPFQPPPPVVGIDYIQHIPLELNDPTNTQNYYELKLSELLTNPNQLPKKEVVDAGLIHYTFKNIHTADERFEIFNYEDNVICYSDKGLNGGLYSLGAYVVVGALEDEGLFNRATFRKPNISYFENAYGLELYSFQPKTGTGDLWEKDFYIELKTISESYYKYTRSRMLQAYNRSIPGSEFNNVYSNIEGGYGIFVGYQSEKKKLDR